MMDEPGGVRRKFITAMRVLKNFGVRQTIDHLFAKGGRNSYLLRSDYAKYPLICRHQSSDKDVFDQIFWHREYRCLDGVADAGLIVDCGANCGYSAAYFLSRYPSAFLVAIEPDTENFQVLKANLKPYRNRYLAIRSGVWSRTAGLVVVDNSDFGDGREWARTVREALPGEVPHIQAVDIGQVLEDSGFERISILKMDIEGSERVVFGNGPPPWLSKVDNMVIELHGKDCEEVVHAAMSGQGFAVSQCEELTVFTR